MNERKITQNQINKIVTVRVNRERERLIKDFENRMKRCMASLHLLLHTEIKEIKREIGTQVISEESNNDK